MAAEPWIIVAVAANLAGYLVYLRGLLGNLVEPNRASWAIWSAAAGIEAATYAAVNPGAAQAWVLILSAAFCLVVTGTLWRRSAWSWPSATETLCIAIAMTALVVWLAFSDAFWAHMLVVAAVPVSFWPTLVSALRDPARERSPAWGLWTIGDAATLLAAFGAGRGRDVGELGYLVVELICHAAIWALVLRHAFGAGRDAAPAARPPRLRIGRTHLGKAVFADEPVAEGARIIRFTGPTVAANRLPGRLAGRRDRFVQVTADLYMGPSGRIDDLVNHSCVPNAGLRFDRGDIWLIAIRPIATGDEIAWDYSTTLTDPSWQMRCACGKADCRAVIGAFDTLPPERQEWYRARNLVAPYLRRRDRVTAPEPARHAANG